MGQRTTTIKDVKNARSFREKVLGLILDKEKRGLLLKTRFGIHTFGMKVPLDIVILNDENKVVKIKKSLMPGKIFVWNPKYKKVLEIPLGSITKSKTVVGDTIPL